MIACTSYFNKTSTEILRCVLAVQHLKESFVTAATLFPKSELFFNVIK